MKQINELRTLTGSDGKCYSIISTGVERCGDFTPSHRKDHKEHEFYLGNYDCLKRSSGTLVSS